MAGETYFPRTSSMSSSGAEPLLPAGRFAPHRREQAGAILGTSFANSAYAIACRSMVYRWLRIQVPPSALQCIALMDGRNALAAANDRALSAVYRTRGQYATGTAARAQSLSHPLPGDWIRSNLQQV